MAEVEFEVIASVYDVTVSSTALDMTDLGFTEAQLNVADRARITVEDADIKMTDDGTVAAGNNGHPLPNGFDGIFQSNRLIVAMQFIRRAGDDAVINVTLYKRV